MEITSLKYIAFCLISIVLIYKLPTKFQWVLLLIDSLIFYFLSAKPYSFVYVISTSLTVWVATYLFDKIKSDNLKLIVLLTTLFFNISMLVILKYSNLGIEIVNLLKHDAIEKTNFYAPLGISFYTLTMTAYLLDSYWGITYTEKNPLKVLLLTSYFPLMISGPICRHNCLGEQLFKKHIFNYDKVTGGLKRVAWGVAKKVVIANRLQPLSYLLFNNSDYYSGIFVIIAAIIFAFQLYFDFSGCMDIICGISSALGVELEENFNAPFFSRTIQEIWQRWHITLGGFMRDYVMNPILKSKLFIRVTYSLKDKYGKSAKKIPSYIAMLVVWILIGIWHGSSIKYIVGEGLYFYIIIVSSQILSPLFKTFYKKLKINDRNIGFIVFRTIRTTILFSVGLIFFNAADMNQAINMIKNIACKIDFNVLIEVKYGLLPTVGGFKRLVVIIVLAAIVLYSDFCKYYKFDGFTLLNHKNAMVRWFSYFIFIFLIIIFGDFGKSSFIYFGF